MAVTESQDRLAARLKIVDEHIARENQHDLEGILRTFGQRHAMMTSPGHYIGHDGVRTYYDGLLKAIPDLHIEVQQRYASQNAVIVEVIITGHHLGAWRGLPPTGRSVRFPLSPRIVPMVPCGSWGLLMNRLLIVAILAISTMPLYAQGQPDSAKLKADAQRVVSMIKGDKAKTEAYCQINKLAEQIGKTDQEKDSKKVEALSRQVFELEIKMGPEYIALANNLKDVDPNSPQGKEIDSILEPLDDSCDNDDDD